MEGIVTADIQSEGKPIDPKYAVIKIDIIQEVNRIPSARIVVRDGDASKQKFPISDTDFFKPGKEVVIKLGYGDKAPDLVFSGMVVKHSIKSSSSGSTLVVDLRSDAYILTETRNSLLFDKKKDHEIIKSIITSAKLKAGKIESTKTVHQQMVQYYATDWDFILTRAEVNGLLVLVNGNEISAEKPVFSGKKTHIIEFGKGSLLDFEMETDIRNQYKSITGTAWDLETQKMSKPVKSEVFKIEQTPVESADFKKEFNLIGEASLEKDEITSWVNAKMMKDRLALLKGRFCLSGDAAYKLLNIIEIKGTGKRFNGKSLITGIRHQLDENGWQTNVQFGLPPDWFANNPAVVSAPAAGMLPYVNGLQIGLAEGFEKDPKGLFRIKVKLPAVDEKKGSIWARLASPDAGKDRGYFFIPEKGDEVVVGFFNDDPRQAVVLGSMYSGKNPPPKPFQIADKNPDKGVVTIGELKLLLNDKDKTIEISTPAGNQLIMKDKEGLQVVDKNGNELVLDDKGISIKSGKDIIIEGKNITIKGSKVDVN